MPLPIIAAIITAIATCAVVIAVIHIAVLVIEKVRTWFEARRAKHGSNELSFILQEKMDNGEYKVVQGFFDQSTSTVTDYQPYEAERLDDETAATIGDSELTIVK